MTSCKRCGRELKDATSKEHGYGPVCYRKEGLAPPKRVKRPKNIYLGESLINYTEEENE